MTDSYEMSSVGVRDTKTRIVSLLRSAEKQLKSVGSMKTKLSQPEKVDKNVLHDSAAILLPHPEPHRSRRGQPKMTTTDAMPPEADHG